MARSLLVITLIGMFVPIAIIAYAYTWALAAWQALAIITVYSVLYGGYVLIVGRGAQQEMVDQFLSRVRYQEKLRGISLDTRGEKSE